MQVMQSQKGSTDITQILVFFFDSAAGDEENKFIEQVPI